MLLFADDTVVLARSAQGLKVKIRILQNYFDSLGLKVNLRKTKIMVFRKGGRAEQSLKFLFNGKVIEIVNEYAYLGVIFTTVPSFTKAALNFRSKGFAALNSVWNLVCKGKIYNFDIFKKLYDACVNSILTYAVATWGINNEDLLEEVQEKFLKSCLGFSKFTPNYLARLELGVDHIRVTVFKAIIKYWLRLMNMEHTSYTKICFLYLIDKVRPSEKVGKFNWAHKVFSKLEELGRGQIWHQQNYLLTKKLYSAICDDF